MIKENTVRTKIYSATHIILYNYTDQVINLIILYVLFHFHENSIY